MRGLVAYTAVAVCAVAGCGRIGFDASGSATGDGASGGSGGDGGDGSGGGSGEPQTVTVLGAADTAINSFAPSFNYGAATVFNVRSDTVSTYVGMMRFDLSAQAGTVVAATLRISTSNAALSNGRIELTRILEPWDEGAQIGGTGVANYTVRQGTTTWTAAGCGPGSRDGVALGEFQPYATNTRYDVTLQTSVVQGWIADPTTNHGFALIASATGNDTVSFYARESATPPELTLEIIK
jgi:hypothetical protein